MTKLDSQAFDSTPDLSPLPTGNGLDHESVLPAQPSERYGFARVLTGRFTLSALLLLLTIHAGLLVWIGAVNSPTMDEVAHLPAGISHWERRDFHLYYVNPPLVRMVAALPVLFTDAVRDWRFYNLAPHARHEFDVGRDFMINNGAESFWYFTLAHWACIPFSLFGGYICFRWARELYGDGAGLFAATLWCFSPTVLGNAGMITPDAPCASLGLAAGYYFWRWMKLPTWEQALFAGFSMGLAELTKTSWLLLFPLWIVLWLCLSLSNRMTLTRRDWGQQASQLGVILTLSLLMINAGYLFEGTGMRLKEHPFVSTALNGDPEPGGVGNRFEGTFLGEIPLPLPRNYIRGIDMQKSDFERRKWSYLAGELRWGGWWYYYLYAICVKVPLGTLLCGLLAVAALFFRSRSSRDWRSELILLTPAVALLVLVSSQTGFNRYIRYVLPAFPFAFVWLSSVVSCTLENRRWLATAASLFLGWSVFSSLSVVPHALSYFNEMAGGPLGGPAHLLDANIDWGQDLMNLRRWLDDHPEVENLRFAYFGFVDPKLAGIDFEMPPIGYLPEMPLVPLESFGPWPGWQAVSVNHVYGYTHYDFDKPVFTYFQHFRPVARAGYSIMIYHISLEEANAVRGQLGLTPLSGYRAPERLRYVAPQKLHVGGLTN